jgi:hypothetical protein
MRFVFKLLLVSVIIFSTIFVVKCLVDNWLYGISHPFFGVIVFG